MKFLPLIDQPLKSEEIIEILELLDMEVFGNHGQRTALTTNAGAGHDRTLANGGFAAT